MAALSRYVGVCEPVTFELGEVDRCFDVVRAQNFIASFKEHLRADPDLLGSNTRTNYEMGLAMSLGDAVWAHAEQTRIFRRFQAVFDRYDLIVSPTCPVSPFPWQVPFLAEMDGRPLENYYRWLGLTYVVSLLTNPALSLPGGTDMRACRSASSSWDRFAATAVSWISLRRLKAHSAMTMSCGGLGRILPNWPRRGWR